MARDAGRTQFFHQCPKQYETLMGMIDGLVFEDSPKYNEFVDVLMDVSISSVNRRYSTVVLLLLVALYYCKL